MNPIVDLQDRPAGPGRWIALETSGLYGSVAAASVDEQGCQIVASEPLSRDARSAQTLAPTISAVLEGLGWEPKEVAAVAVAVGPGSFTGLRVGVVTAKTFAYATGAAVVGVDTLDVLAKADTAAKGVNGLWAVLDAQRRELFAARFVPNGVQWAREESTQRLSRAALCDYLREGDRVVGPVAESLADSVEGGTPVGVEFVTAEPQAEAVLRAAHRRWRDRQADSVLGIAPQYFRLSSAEEKLASD
ncbi:tRNA threonylcarbamoyladenosine biosynthesis protein TsaB [Planctomycetes bacterium MalM25]|nr:tRNA threonylcarbamoyladenosine biosynthesis protein TsaB [Planctomycetes bacterium MalM25]